MKIYLRIKWFSSVPNNFFIGWIKDNYVKMIRDSLQEVTGTRYEMNFKSRDDFGNRGIDSVTEPLNQSSLLESMSMTDEFALKRNLEPSLYVREFCGWRLQPIRSCGCAVCL